MIIDLHCHTKATKKGDGSGRNVTPAAFAKAIRDRGVGIVGVTNHNAFDREQYDELVAAVGDDAQVWPGVELDVRDSASQGTAATRWHMVVVSNPERVDDFGDALCNLVGKTRPDDYIGEVKDVLGAFLAEGQDALFISHCRNKRPSIPEPEISNLLGMVPKAERWRLFLEEKDLRTIGIWTYDGRQMLFGSDVKDWALYDAKDVDGAWFTKLPELRLSVNSFAQLAKLAQRDGHLIKTLLGDKGPHSYTVHPNAGVDVEIQLYDEVNVIFGGKGTGKTEMLKSLEPILADQGKKVSFYRGSSKAQQYDALMSVDGVERLPEGLGREGRAEDVTALTVWSDMQPTPISDYVQWKSTEGNSNSKDRFLITRGSSLVEGKPTGYKSHLAAAGKVAAFIELCEGDGDLLQYVSEEDGATLMDLLYTVRQGAMRMAREAYIEYKSIELANSALASIKELADGRSDTKSKPGNTGFLRYVRGRADLGLAAKRLYDQSGERRDSSDRRFSDEALGTLDGKGSVVIRTRWRYLGKKSETSEFNAGINSLKAIRAAWKSISSDIGASDLGSRVKKVSDACKEKGISDLSSFIGVSRYCHIVGTDDNEKYVPSDGEKGMLMLSRVLEASADVYLLDEPEAGMGNSYIEAAIRPLVSKRGRERRMVVMATHNANLAVRTLPYASVYREYVPGVGYRTFEGNPFVNEMEDVEGRLPSLSWSAKSMDVLEGGAEAFGDRASIYAAGKEPMQNEDD